MAVKDVVEKARKAFNEIADYSQEQVDKLVYEVGKIIYQNAEVLAEEAVAETGLGRVAHKIAKNTDTPAGMWDYMRDKKSVGIINEIPESGLIEVAHPVGIIAAVIPATNPTVTTTGNFMHAIKGKNAMIATPAPRAVNTITHTVNLIREALVEAGAPADLLQILENPTFEMTGELMTEADLVLATGGFGLTMAAYSSGTPAYGVGPGNSPVILDRGYDIKTAARISMESKSADNGILCDGTEALFYPEELEAELFDALRNVQVAVFEDEADVDKVRQLIFPDGHVDSSRLGKEATVIAGWAGLEVPADTELIALKIDAIGADDILNDEIMAPVMVMKSYSTFEEAVDMAITNLENNGIGHTAGIFSNDQEHIRYASEHLPVSRILVNQPTTDAWGPNTNGLAPAVSEGCGTWGNNIISENLDYIHLLNVSKVAMPLDVEPLDPKAVFAD